MTKKIKPKKEESPQLLPEVTRNDDGGYEINSTSQSQVQNLFAAVGTENEKILSKRLMETMLVLEGKPGANTAGVALSLLSEIAPRDGVEGMLAAQMVATHEMAMIMARRAIASETVDIIESAVNLTTKLNRTFTAQMDALQRHRTKGKQKIIVEHQQVTVESGGQAVIGDVHHGGGGKKEK